MLVESLYFLAVDLVLPILHLLLPAEDRLLFMVLMMSRF
jgi:hypothetical protein